MKIVPHAGWRLKYNGEPVSLWTRIKIWIWLRRTERTIKKEMESLGYKKL